MKAKHSLFIASALLAVTGIVSGFGVTYAGYVAQQTLPSATEVGVAATSRLIWLDVSQDLGNGETWAKDSPTFWVYTFKENGNDDVVYGWVRGAQDDEYAWKYRFRVNNLADRFIFGRFNSTITEPDFTAEGRTPWNRTTGDASLPGDDKRTLKVTSWAGAYTWW